MHQRDLHFINGPMATVIKVKSNGNLYKRIKGIGRTYTLINMQTGEKFYIVAVNGWSASGQSVKQITKWEKE